MPFTWPAAFNELWGCSALARRGERELPACPCAQAKQGSCNISAQGCSWQSASLARCREYLAAGPPQSRCNRDSIATQGACKGAHRGYKQPIQQWPGAGRSLSRRDGRTGRSAREARRETRQRRRNRIRALKLLGEAPPRSRPRSGCRSGRRSACSTAARPSRGRAPAPWPPSSITWRGRQVRRPAWALGLGLGLAGGLLPASLLGAGRAGPLAGPCSSPACCRGPKRTRPERPRTACGSNSHHQQ